MLVLTRKEGESIKIGGNVTVTIISIQGNRVRLGIEAPLEVEIVRGELPGAAAVTEVEIEIDEGDGDIRLEISVEEEEKKAE